MGEFVEPAAVGYFDVDCAAALSVIIRLVADVERVWIIVRSY
ncbi:MAG: hypothetical protein DGJ47_000689 [Rickettsiaceae bacterium]